MRLLTALLLTAATSSSIAQNAITVNVSGNIFNTDSDSVFISQFFGTHYVDYLGAPFNDDNTFTLEGELPNPDYYVIRFGKQHLNLILRDKSDIKVYGDGSNITRFSNVLGSQETTDMNSFLFLMNDWQAKQDTAIAQIKRNPELKAQINQSMATEFKRFQGQQQAFVAKHPNSAALYPVLSTIDMQNDFASYESIVSQLNSGFPESPTIKTAMENMEKAKIERLKNDPLAPGKLAPDFEEKLPNGETMKLSDLRGQIVLLDFWASWCGPCRRENPNVVKMYKKYQDDGFTVMSVSLDKVKDNWLKAIEKDNLTWPNHVSDLKHWGSEVAKLYGVRGIPFTVLIDQEGKIIRTKLRGPELEKELARIFGH